MVLTEEEFLNNYTGFQSPNNLTFAELPTDPLPDSVDWRQKNVVYPAKEQGDCGACWAFTTIATVESLHAILTGKLVGFSEQALVDCARNGNYGCEGGALPFAYDYIRKFGIPTEDRYPFVGF